MAPHYNFSFPAMEHSQIPAQKHLDHTQCYETQNNLKNSVSCLFIRWIHKHEMYIDT